MSSDRPTPPDSIPALTARVEKTERVVESAGDWSFEAFQTAKRVEAKQDAMAADIAALLRRDDARSPVTSYVAVVMGALALLVSFAAMASVH